MRATAAVLHEAIGAFSIEEVVLPAPAAGELLVRIAGVGMCHTDLLPRAGVTVAPPIIVGHEGSGVVEAIGPDVQDLAVGDHVVLSFDSCGGCRNCSDAQPAYCDSFALRNLYGARPDGSRVTTLADGRPVAASWFGQSSFASHVVCAARSAVKVDASLPLELLGPLACGVQTGAGAVMNSLRVSSGATLVVFGAGSVGLSAVMAAKVVGASAIIAIDRNEQRLALAEKLGATAVVLADVPELLKTVRRAAGSGGADFALDTTGVPFAIAAAIDSLRPTGVCGLVGAQRGDLTLGPSQIAFGKTVKGIIEGDAVPRVFIPALIELWRSGRFPFEALIETFPLTEINEAEQAMHAGAVVKPVLIP